MSIIPLEILTFMVSHCVFRLEDGEVEKQMLDVDVVIGADGATLCVMRPLVKF